MRGEFIGVWSEARREIWEPLIDEFLLETEEGAPEDLFCELYRELAKALRKPSGSAAVAMLIKDAIALREVFEGAAHRAKRDLARELIDKAFDRSGVAEAMTIEQRRTLLVAPLSVLVGEPGAPLLDTQLLEHSRDEAKVLGAWNRAVEKTINDARASRESFENATGEDLAGEQAAVGFFEAAHSTLEGFEDHGDDALTNRYFNLLAAFMEKYSLRYDIRRPCIICPTLPGIFASLVRSLSSVAERDANVARRLRDFKEALQDLRLGSSEARIGNCVARQVMLLEAIASAGGASGTDLGALCRSVSEWPHPAVRASLLNLYGFASDFPGLRHGTPSRGMSRDLDMRDMVAMSILLVGFTPHLTRQISADAIYGCSEQTVTLATASAVRAPMMSVGATSNSHGRRGSLQRLFDRLLGRDV